jgi:uncharacterized membrane protein required for colicin V production
MYWLDTVILLVLGMGAILGALTGLLWQVLRLGGLIVAVYASIFFHDWAANMLQESFLRGADPNIARVLGYVILFVPIYAIFVVATLLLEKFIKAAKLRAVDRLFGAGLGIVQTALILGAVFLGMANYPHPRTQELMEKSTFAPALADGMNLVIAAVPEEYKRELTNGLKQLRDTIREKAQQTRQARR